MKWKLSRKLVHIIFLQFLFVASALSQTVPLSKYGVPVITNIKTYITTVQRDSNYRMIELKSIIPGIVYDLKYATPNNFMHRKIYQNGPMTFLRLPAAKALNEVQRDLNAQGLELKVWDAYRPYSITEKFWEQVKDERYAADPAKGSGHNRGIAIDVTLIDLHSGKELPMPTGFDNFSDTAHFGFMNLPEDVLKNRQLLKEVMEKHGFKSMDTEWWHYALKDGDRFDLMDIDFEELQKANEKIKITAK